MKRIFLLVVALTAWYSSSAQDPRERVYNYEVLQPSQEAKPHIEGFATQPIVETFHRAPVALLSADEKGIYLGWRLLESDPADVCFVVERSEGKSWKRLTAKPLQKTTDFVDARPVAGKVTYRIRPCDAKGRAVNAESGEVEVSYAALKKAPRYESIQTSGRNIGKIGIGDLDGDGKMDFVIRTPETNVDPGVQGRHFDSVYTISGYRHDGTHLWSYSLGEGVEPGVWYSPFAVYDFDGDGRAEVAMRICPDGTRDEKHHVMNGHEYLVVLDGTTGQEIARADWPERTWRLGERNRQSRHQIGVAKLDGRTPCILACRGTYRAMIVDAWQLHDGKLSRLWRWDGDEENPVIRSQGAHNMVVGDVDADGRDEILLGACMIDDNGSLLWSAGTGHPDKIYLTDIDPRRPGMEVLLCVEVHHEDGRGVTCVDAATGAQIWNIGHDTHHVGDGMVADIDPTHPGLECFASEDRKGGSELRYLLTADGQKIESERIPPCRNWVWWDADLLREPLIFGTLMKWPETKLTEHIEGFVQMIVDWDGDWREEIITSVGNELRIYRTNIPARDRRTTLMQDPIYRSYIIEHSQGYPQSPVPGYYLGEPIAE